MTKIRKIKSFQVTCVCELHILKHKRTGIVLSPLQQI